VMKVISKGELLHIRDVLLSILEEEVEEVDISEAEEALEIIEALLNGEEVTVVCQESE